MRKGWNLYFAAALLALMAPAMASASVARIAGLNTPGDYVKGEYTGMFTYLSEVHGTGNLAWIEAGSAQQGLGDHAVGTVLPNLFNGNAGVWAFSLRQQQPAIGQNSIDTPVGTGGYDPNRYAGEAFDILWGQKVGSGNLGLRLNRSHYSYDDGSSTEEGNGNNGRNVLGFGAGYDFATGSGTLVELAGQYQQRAFENSATDKSTDGEYGYLFAARAFRTCANATVIPVVKFYGFDTSVLSGTTTNKSTLNGWQVGIASNWTLGAGDLFILGGEVARNAWDYGNSNESTHLYAPNVFASFETHINPWLTFRAGAQNTMYFTDKSTTATTEQTWKEQVFSFNMGTSVKLGNLVFDAVLDPAFLQNPFAQLGGGTQAAYYYNYWDKRPAGSSINSVAFTQVSATYTW